MDIRLPDPRLSVPILGLFMLAACGTAPPVSDRPPDGLLSRPDLQAIVVSQEARDSAALIARLADPDPAVRARAAFALASVQDPGALGPLTARLQDDILTVRTEAAFALGQLGDSTAAPALLRTLMRESDPVLRSRVLEALGKSGGPGSLRQLLAVDLPEALRPDLAMAVARFGLRGIFAPEATAFLAGALTGRDPRLRLNAAYFFGRMRDIDLWRESADEVRQALDQFGTGDPAAVYLVQALGRLGAEEDADRILDALRNAADWRTRTTAAAALGAFTARERVRRSLLAALADPSRHVGITAARALAAAAPELNEAELTTLADWAGVHSEQWQVAVELLPALAAAGRAEVVLQWLATLPAAEVRARSRGLTALASVPGRAAFDRLRDDAGSDDPLIAAAAVGALAARWRRRPQPDAGAQEYFAVFSRAVTSGDIGRSLAAAGSLADSAFVAMGSVTVLASAWRGMSTPHDVEPMVAILQALGATGSPDGHDVLQQALGHREGAVRAAAADGLAELTGERPALGPIEPDPVPEVDWAWLASLGPEPRLELETEKGRIVVVAAVEEAPLTVATILRLADEGRFDSIAFHRVVPNFVVQGGDVERQDGLGGPGFDIRSEFTRVAYRRGVIGMASAGKDTEGSQYFITHSMQPHLDGRYTAFGYVVEGMAVVDALYEGDRVIAARVSPGPARRR